MNIPSRRSFILRASCLVCGFKFLSCFIASAQTPFPVAIPPDAQRNSSTQVRSEVKWLQDATRTAPSYGQQGYGHVWERFQTVRGTYQAFKQTLSPNQLAQGANDLAELDAGLDIIQGAFDNYQTDTADGRPVNAALRDLCQVLREGSQLWLQEFNQTCSRLRTSWH